MRAFVRSPFVVSLLVSLLVCLGLLGLRQAGGFEPLELAAYDWLLRLRPEAPEEQQISGIALHAHIVSQLLRSALGGHATITAASDSEEALWPLLGSVLGAMLGVWVRSPWRLAACVVGGVLLLGCAGFSVLAYGWWIPVVPPVHAWMLSAALLEQEGLSEAAAYDRQRK